MAQLVLNRASTSRPSGEWNEDDYDVPIATHATTTLGISSWCW